MVNENLEGLGAEVMGDPTRPCLGVYNPTLSDTENDPNGPFRQLRVLADGDVSIECADGTTWDLTMTEGSTLPWATFFRRVNDIGTSLTGSQIECGK
jgi:hypothetical protein